TRELGEPEDALGGQVGDMRHTVERQQVVHAQRLKRDLPDDDQLVVALVVGKRRRVERLGGEQLGVGGRHPARCVAKAGGVQVGAQRHEQVGGGSLGGGAIDRRSR